MARPALPRRELFASWVPMQVRWADPDMLGHVNNAVYFTYSESARMAWFEAIAKPAMQADSSLDEQGIILASTACDFIAQLRYPQALELGTRVTEIGSSSIKLQCAMFAQGSDSPAAVTHSVIVWFDYASQRAAPVPDPVRAAIIESEPAL